MQETLVIAFVLVVLVIFVFLGRARDTLIPAMALPMSLLLTFAAMWALGYSLDNLSLMALTLAIGFLVDDAIVFLENTVRRMETYGEAGADRDAQQRPRDQLHDRVDDALAGGGVPAAGADERADGPHLPRVLGHDHRRDLRQRPGVADAHADDVLAPAGQPRARTSRSPGWSGCRARVEHKVLGVYGRSLTWALRHHYLSAVAWVVCLVGTVYLFSILPKTFLPVGDSGFIWGLMIGPDKASYQKMRQYQDVGDALMQADPGGRRHVHHDRQRAVPHLQPGPAAGVPGAARQARRRSREIASEHVRAACRA